MNYPHFGRSPERVKVAVYTEAAPSEKQDLQTLQVVVAIGLFALSGWVLAVANTSF